MKGGKYLRVARGDAGEVARAQDVLRDSKATELTCHGEDCSAPAA